LEPTPAAHILALYLLSIEDEVENCDEEDDDNENRYQSPRNILKREESSCRKIVVRNSWGDSNGSCWSLCY
jgi:hypothetical protein